MEFTTLVVFLSLGPLLGQSCSCFRFPDRSETLRRGICYGEVYSGVVVGATCSCIVPDIGVDCREYTYSEDGNTYSAEVITRAQFDSDDYFRSYFLKTCTQAEDILAPEGILQSNGTDVPVENGTYELVCSFNNPSGPEMLRNLTVCLYSVRVMEVFIGQYSVDDVISSAGPDILTSCATEFGRILQLNTEYLVGVGGFCSSAFRDWEPLSAYSERDLDQLRQLAEEKPEKYKDTEECLNRALPSATTITTMVVMTAGFIAWVIQ